jgi:hypothetical protein
MKAYWGNGGIAPRIKLIERFSEIFNIKIIVYSIFYT